MPRPPPRSREWRQLTSDSGVLLLQAELGGALCVWGQNDSCSPGPRRQEGRPHLAQGRTVCRAGAVRGRLSTERGQRASLGSLPALGVRSGGGRGAAPGQVCGLKTAACRSVGTRLKVAYIPPTYRHQEEVCEPHKRTWATQLRAPNPRAPLQVSRPRGSRGVAWRFL